MHDLSFKKITILYNNKMTLPNKAKKAILYNTDLTEIPGQSHYFLFCIVHQIVDYVITWPQRIVAQIFRFVIMVIEHFLETSLKSINYFLAAFLHKKNWFTAASIIVAIYYIFTFIKWALFAYCSGRREADQRDQRT